MVKISVKLKNSRYSVLLDKTLRLISLRPRSKKEITDYLKKKKASPEEKLKIFETLEKLNLVDDFAFAEWWLDQRSTFRPKGKIALKAELSQKGIDRLIIDQALVGVDEVALAEKALQKKLEIYRSLSPLKFRQKIANFLAQRGFSWEIIKKVLEQTARK